MVLFILNDEPVHIISSHAEQCFGDGSIPKNRGVPAAFKKETSQHLFFFHSLVLWRVAESEEAEYDSMRTLSIGPC